MSLQMGKNDKLALTQWHAIKSLSRVSQTAISLLLLFITHNATATVLNADVALLIDSEDGVSVFGNQEVWTNADHSTKNLNFSPKHFQVEITENGSNTLREYAVADGINIEITSPDNQVITSGNYENIPYIDFSKLSFKSGWWGNKNCLDPLYMQNQLTIYEYSEQSNTIAADFQLQCKVDKRTLRGQLRINTAIPFNYSKPIANAGPDKILAPSEQVVLQGADHLHNEAKIISWHWNKVSGPDLAISSSNSKYFTFTAPLSSKEVLIYKFELTIKYNDGQEDKDEVKIYVSPDRNIYHGIKTQLGNYMPGRFNFYNEISIPRKDESNPFVLVTDNSFTTKGIAFGLTNKIPVETLVQFNGSHFSDLVEGQYLNAARAAFHGFQPGFQSYLDACNMLDGTFVIQDISYDVLGYIESFSADAISSCGAYEMSEGDVGLRRTVTRFNSVIPFSRISPDPIVNGNKVIAAGKMIRLTSYLTDVGLNRQQRYNWTQKSGPALNISNAKSSVIEISQAEIVNQVQEAELLLTVTLPNGEMSQQIVKLTLLPDNAMQSRFFYHSGLGFTTPSGVTLGQEVWERESGNTLMKLESELIQTPQGERERISVYTDYKELTLDLYSAPGEKFQEGIYANVTEDYYSATTYFRILREQETFPSATCYGENFVLERQLKITQLIRDSSGKIISISLDGDILCDSDIGTQHLQMRVNSNIDLDRVTARLNTPISVTATEGETLSIAMERSLSNGGDFQTLYAKQLYGYNGVMRFVNDKLEFMPPPIRKSDEMERHILTLGGKSTHLIDIANPTEVLVTRNSDNPFPADYYSITSKNGTHTGLQYDGKGFTIIFSKANDVQLPSSMQEVVSPFDFTTKIVSTPRIITVDRSLPNDFVWLIQKRSGEWEENGCNVRWLNKTDESTFEFSYYTADESLSFDLDGSTENIWTQLRLAGTTYRPKPVTVTLGEDKVVRAGDRIELTGLASNGCKLAKMNFTWKQIEGPLVTTDYLSGAVMTFKAPDVTVDTKITMELTAIDENNNLGMDMITIVVKAKTTPTPNPTEEQGSSSGGGSMSYTLILLFLLLASIKSRKPFDRRRP